MACPCSNVDISNFKLTGRANSYAKNGTDDGSAAPKHNITFERVMIVFFHLILIFGLMYLISRFVKTPQF